jgi:hypothetical protein
VRACPVCRWRGRTLYGQEGKGDIKGTSKGVRERGND